MRINKFIAASTGLSRRAADTVVQEGRVTIDGVVAATAATVGDASIIKLDGRMLHASAETQTILLNKPAGYVVSRDGQGSKTIYELLPAKLQQLKPIGRLDKDSSGLLLLTNDGELAHRLTHPSFQKVKIYQITLDKPLQPLHRQMINDIGIQLEDGSSKLDLERLEEGNDTAWRITMREGRNRQIRRTFAALGYKVTELHRTHFGPYALGRTTTGQWRLTGKSVQ
jgi:23S rRNA pseudouridine2605 synthase